MSAQRVVARVFIPGRPRTKGSMKPGHTRGTAGRPCKVWLREDHEESKPWMRDMIKALRASRTYSDGDGQSLTCPVPVEVHLFFRFERERSVAVKTAGKEWPSHDIPWPTATDIGDEDKLRRNVLDALTQSGVLADDRLSVGGMNYKRWCQPGEQAGVTVVVLTAPALDAVLELEGVAPKGTEWLTWGAPS